MLLVVVIPAEETQLSEAPAGVLVITMETGVRQEVTDLSM